MPTRRIGKRKILTILRRDLKIAYGAQNAGIIVTSFEEQADWEELDEKLKAVGLEMGFDELTAELILSDLGMFDWYKSKEGWDYWGEITSGLDVYLRMFTNHLIGG